MLKYDIKNYFRQFTKTLITCSQSNTTHAHTHTHTHTHTERDLVIGNYVWLE